jgi:DNA-binding NtrC family response regulator
VDDEAGIRENYKDFFSKRGFSVEVASDGEEAWRKLSGGSFDVALVDIKMPRMDGIELAERIHNDQLSVEVIILTGHGDRNEAVRALKSGAFDWFDKGAIDMLALLKSVQRAAEPVGDDELRQLFSLIPESHFDKPE